MLVCYSHFLIIRDWHASFRRHKKFYKMKSLKVDLGTVSKIFSEEMFRLYQTKYLEPIMKMQKWLLVSNVDIFGRTLVHYAAAQKGEPMFRFVQFLFEYLRDDNMRLKAHSEFFGVISVMMTEEHDNYYLDEDLLKFVEKAKGLEAKLTSYLRA
jgi:hypothetical protein